MGIALGAFEVGVPKHLPDSEKVHPCTDDGSYGFHGEVAEGRSWLERLLATLLAQRGWHVIGTGRDPARCAQAEAEIRGAASPSAKVGPASSERRCSPSTETP